MPVPNSYTPPPNNDRIMTPFDTNVFQTPYDVIETERSKNSYPEKKSYLAFLFPNETTLNGVPTRLILPFFEDPNIRERKTARYAQYNPIGRASQLFSYLGADSRLFDIEFNITLPNLIRFYSQSMGQQVQGIDPANIGQQQQDYFAPVSESQGLFGPSPLEFLNESMAFKYDQQEEKNPDAADGAQALAFNNAISVEGAQDLLHLRSGMTHLNVLKLIDIIRYWVDIIRSSCYNNTDNPSLGPPIVRLTHGILFRNLPCVATSYDISYDGIAGYHKNTVLPRRIIVRMNLKEVRVGTFGDFVPTAINGEEDNLAGWEFVTGGQGGGTLDPTPIMQPPLAPNT